MNAVPLFSVFCLSSVLWIYTVAGALTHRLPPDAKVYDKNVKPGSLTEVAVSLYINRISGVDENREEISIDVFLQVTWEDPRLLPADEPTMTKQYVELTPIERETVWVPDLYIRQLREMKVMALLEEFSSLRLYKNSTLVLSIGATIIFKCDMDFVLYPLDVQRCPVDFSSYKYTVKEMRFRWKTDNALAFPHDFGDGFFRLPKYVVSFYTEQEPQVIHYGDDNHSSARLEITLSREVKSYLLENYLPSTLFVSMSWGSFVVVPEIVPGRMVLLVTTLLSLITMFDTVRNNSPDALELKCLEVWLISCTLFVFFALMEYFIVLFGIRYDKHWRVAAKSHIQVAPPVQLQPTINLSQSTVETPMNSSHAQRENGLESSGGLKVTGTNKVQPQESDPTKPTHSSLGNLSGNFQNTQHVTSVMTRRRFRNVADVALMYAGSQRGRLDQISLIIFPLSFLIFTIAYWTMYISESNKSK
ncbi:glycine receptor subunit alphaZ1-like isoform X2 [Toxorhynchites rutilus septentrionalis]|uniref:glycine receptor subunit alphaZ1-like isoform X2 n=1 Tax=Toxorhynchites rutilus septentrionalis TaxID=329112 RepID=UPI00247AB8D7|nr:glycine receptor subunit alphaZ1-like isoform X2 [Toxorhynchites rutilus septentrionalis]